MLALECTNLISNERRAFLRQCRNRLSPDAAGLPSRSKRRCVGINRDEAAELIGVSSTWYTQFEYGKSRNFSLRFVESVCAGMQLAPEQRMYLLALCGYGHESTETQTVDDDVLAALAKQPELPMAVFDPGLRLMHANVAFERMKDTREADLSREYAVRLFNDASYRELYTEWDSVAAVCCGLLRMHLAYRRPDAFRTVKELADNLDFRRRWREGDLLDPSCSRFTESLCHPNAGPLRTTVSVLGLQAGTRFIAVHSALDEDTADRLRWLATS